MEKFLIRRSHVLQVSSSKKIRIDLDNLFSYPMLWKNVSFEYL